ncbi:hypothetical protein OAO87_02595 [bacterium]|nr:hypothetical protein [bacterium]
MTCADATAHARRMTAVAVVSALNAVLVRTALTTQQLSFDTQTPRSMH